MGIASAAKALDLDFIPLGEEEYDFAVLNEFLDLKEIQIFIDLIKTSAFHGKLEQLGHPVNAYTWRRTGEVLRISFTN
jgi:putative molybdopterin biosynthesis protein